jgi:hypothetical protein
MILFSFSKNTTNQEFKVHSGHFRPVPSASQMFSASINLAVNYKVHYHSNRCKELLMLRSAAADFMYAFIYINGKTSTFGLIKNMFESYRIWYQSTRDLTVFVRSFSFLFLLFFFSAFCHALISYCYRNQWYSTVSAPLSRASPKYATPFLA